MKEKTAKENKLWRVITYIIYTIVVIFALLAISAKFSIGGIKLLVVKSGSMEPTIKTGSLVIDKSQTEYQIGEIVTFRNLDHPNETLTHRIVSEDIQDDLKLFTTKGDANEDADALTLSQDKILGRVVFQLPYLGYLVAFTRTWPGVIILIIIPATIIIYDEAGKLKKELIIRYQNKDKKRERKTK